MGRLTDEFVAFLKEDTWNYTLEEKEGHNAIFFSYSGKNGTLKTHIFLREEIEVACVYSKLEVTVPEDKRLKVGEFLSRANYGLLVGNFEIDFRDGEVRYKASADFEGTTTSSTSYRNLLHANLSTADRYYPALMKMIWSDELSAEAAIEMIEGGSSD